MNILFMDQSFRLILVASLMLSVISGSVLEGRVVSNVLTVYGVVPAKIRMDSVASVVDLAPMAKSGQSQVVGEVAINAFQVKKFKFSLISKNNGKIIAKNGSGGDRSVGYKVTVSSQDGTNQMAQLSSSKISHTGVDVLFPQPQSETEAVKYDVAVKVADAQIVQKTDLSDKLTFQIAAL